MKLRSIILVFIMLGALNIESRGQMYNSSSGSTGMFGNRITTGQMFSPGTRTFSGSSTLGGMGMSGGMNSMGLGNVGQLDSSDRFVRGNRQAGAFVGANTSTQTGFVGDIQAGQNQGMQGYNQDFGLNSGQYMGNARTSYRTNRANQQSDFGQGGYGGQYNRNQTRIPIIRHVAFEYPKPSGANFSSALTQRLQEALGFRSLAPLEVAVQGGIVVLQGRVATAHDRELAALLVRLEPGVDKVQNDLIVGTTAPQAEEDSHPR